VIRKDSCW